MHGLISDTLVEKAAGMFRWVYCQLEELSTCLDKPAVRRVLRTLPNDLNETYDRILHKIPDSNVPNAIKLLQLLVFSKRPLRLEEVIDAVATESDIEPPFDAAATESETELPFDAESRVSPPDAIIAYCPGLVRITTTHENSFADVEPLDNSKAEDQEIKVIQLAHFSVREYLLLMRKENPICRCFETRVAHAAITRLFLAYLWTAAEAQDTQKFPLVKLAAGDWMKHAAIAGEEEETTFAWTRRIFTVRSFLQFCEQESPMDPSSVCLPALYYASKIALQRSVKYLLSTGANPNAQGGYLNTALQAASASGNVQTVQVLLAYGASINARGGYFGSALHAAAGYDNIDTLQLLLKHGADTGALQWEGGCAATTLQLAASEGHTKTVAALLTHGADVNARNNQTSMSFDCCCFPTLHYTALEAASFKGHIEAVKVLLNNNAEIDARGYRSSTYEDYGSYSYDEGCRYGTPLQAASTEGRLDIVRLLVKTGADIDAKSGLCGYALHAALSRGHTEVSLFLINSGANIHLRGGFHETALNAAVAGGVLAMVRLLIEKGVDIGQSCYNGDSALILACARGETQIAELLLDNRAEINAPGGKNGTALCAASANGYLDIVQMLLDRGADVNIQAGEHNNALQASCVHYARGPVDQELVELLLQSGAEVNAQGGGYSTALCAASKGGFGELVRRLLDSGAGVNARAEYGSALYLACLWADAKIVRLLLDNGAEVNARGAEHGTALHAASYRRCIEVVRLLLDSGAEVNARGGIYGTALCSAFIQGFGQFQPVMQVLLDKGADPNAHNYGYDTLLYMACYREDLAVATMLLAYGADPNIQSGELGTALAAALDTGSLELMQTLLENGADPNARKDGADTPLYMASYDKNSAMATMLLKFGADPNIQGGNIGTALAVASYRNSTDLVQLLLDNGADVNSQGGWYGNALQSSCCPQSYVIGLGMIQLLLNNGASINARGGEYGTALCAASSKGELEVVKLLLREGADADAPGGKYYCALCAAAYKGHINVARVLLENGAVAGTSIDIHEVALQDAIEQGNLDIAELLFEQTLKDATKKGDKILAELLFEEGVLKELKKDRAKSNPGLERSESTSSMRWSAEKLSRDSMNCVSISKISQISAADAPIRPQDYDSTDDSERRTSHEEKPVAATSQVTNPEHPHGLRLAAIVVALCLATLLAALDQTIMATAAPKITDHFKSIDDIAWYAASYLLAKAALQPSFGRIYSTLNLHCKGALQSWEYDKVSWRWCFYINLPIGALTIVMIAFLLQVPRLDNTEQLSLWQRIKKLDLVGASLLIPATVCLLLALQWGGTTYPWDDSRMIALFVVGGVLTIAFIYTQSKLGSKATLPPYLFKNRNTLCAFIFSGLFGAGFFSLTYYLSIYFHSVNESSSLHSGIQMLPLLISSSVSSTCTGLLISRLGYYTPFIVGCMALFACGAGLLTTLSIQTPYVHNLGYQILTGFGVGIGFEGGIIAVQTVLSGRDIPVAISVVSFFMTIGGAIFVPISQTVFQNGFLAAIKTLAPQLDGHVFLKAGATQVRAILSMMHEEGLLGSVLQAYCHALQHVFWVVTACAIAAVIAACGLEWKSVRKA
ncbi:MFS general substrate transporter, partial [Aureobasidium melanogenum]